MSKLNNDQVIELYHKRKQGRTIPSIAKEYGINSHRVEYLVRLLDRHGKNILRNGKNRYYSPVLKQEIINKVFIEHQSVTETAIQYGLNSVGILSNWIKIYKENGYTIIEKKRGRRSIMKNNQKTIDPNDKDAIIKQKDEEILRLRAENEYLKKLRAVVQARKDRQPKKK